MDSFEIVEETVAYKRFLCLSHRLVRYPDARQVSWDVVGHPTPLPTFAVIMPYFTKTRTTALVYEYAQGPNKMQYTFAAGQFDRRKHSSVQEAAECELSEEMALRGGTWIALNGSDLGVSEVKWCTNTFVSFLVIDPEMDPDPKPQDAEEYMRPEYQVTIAKLNMLICQGQLMLPSVQTAHMALRKLMGLKMLTAEQCCE